MKTIPQLLLCLGATLGVASASRAFSGENPIQGNPWYHELISEEAAKKAGFSAGAADSTAWNSDFLDSYLYSPLWWVQGAKNGATGAIDRFRISLMTGPEMEKLHFDDLFAAPRVHQAWKRYAIGAFAGLMWASERNDVAAAQNIVGTSLHAMQDFYSHSNWVDEPGRRPLTYMDMALAERERQPLYTGAYELNRQVGVKHHGKFLPSAIIFKRPAVNTLMKTACSAISPLANGEMCRQFKMSEDAQSVNPDLAGGKIPDGVVYVAPKGIALDNKWLAGIAVEQRGLVDAEGKAMNEEVAFNLAKDLADRQSLQWLTALERAMNRAGQGVFWNRVKTTNVSQNDREKQFENYGQLPYLFMTAGPYHEGDGDGIYLRWKIRTASERKAGTNADIEVKAGGRTNVLDWGRGVNPFFAYNDFERGDHDSYVTGPYATLPTSVTLKNNAPSARDKLRALGQDFKKSFVKAGHKIRDLALSSIGGHADVVAENQRVFMPDDLAGIGTRPVTFTMRLTGDSEGNYQVRYKIARVERGKGRSTYRVELEKLQCVKESKWDRGTRQDEPFTMVLLNALPGDLQPFSTPAYKDVDSGDERAINHTFRDVTLDDDFGMLSIAMMQMESDSEGARGRTRLLQEYARTAEEPTRNIKSQFVTAIADGVAPDWKVSELEIYAFDRRTNHNSPLLMGTVYNKRETFEIEGRKERTISLDTSAFRGRGVTRSMLLNERNELGLIPNAGAVLDLGRILKPDTRKPPKPIVITPRQTEKRKPPRKIIIAP